MQKKTSLLTLLIITPLVIGALSSCDLFGQTKLKPIGNIQQKDGYYTTDEFSLNYVDVADSNFIYPLKATGTSKILVVPVQFADGPVWTSGMISNIRNAFFGTSIDTGWESVASYYSKSSYGSLNITGEVDVPFKITTHTVETAAKWGDEIDNEVCARYVAEKRKNDPGLLSSYDTDKNGIVDAVCFIYSNPQSTHEAYWAWVNWTGQIKPAKGQTNINMHMWASYNFIFPSVPQSSIDIDTNVFIHETGHLLGLDDYYPYSGNYRAAGGLEMMDHNIMDHSSYSKLLLGWTKPYVVDGTKETTTISIRPFESSGDVIMVRNNWNGSALDEYLLIEYYTPTGLNEKDVKTPTTNTTGFTIPGIKIYHVDSRVARLYLHEDKTFSFDGFISTYPELSRYYYSIAAANSDAWSYLPFGSKAKLLHLMEATGTNSFKDGAIANDATLFQAGQTFIPSSTFFQYGTNFNDGTPIGYKINIESLDDQQAKINIIKV